MPARLASNYSTACAFLTALICQSFTAAAVPSWMLDADEGERAYSSGQLVQAQTRLSQALTAARTTGQSRYRLIYILKSLAKAYHYDGKYQDAEKCWQEALQLADKPPEGPILCAVLDGYGLTLRMKKDYPGSRALFARLLRLQNECDPQPQKVQCMTLVHLAELDCLTGNFAQAEAEAKRSLALANKRRDKESKPAQFFALQELGNIRLAQKDDAGAEAAFAQAREKLVGRTDVNSLSGLTSMDSQLANIRARLRGQERGNSP